MPPSRSVSGANQPAYAETPPGLFRFPTPPSSSQRCWLGRAAREDAPCRDQPSPDLVWIPLLGGGGGEMQTAPLACQSSLSSRLFRWGWRRSGEAATASPQASALQGGKAKWSKEASLRPRAWRNKLLVFLQACEAGHGAPEISGVCDHLAAKTAHARARTPRPSLSRWKVAAWPVLPR